MANTDNPKQIYVVISQTGTILSRLLKIITKAEYNHSSISIAEDLSIMYSFGRKNPYNPFWAGFVTESPNFGTFKRFYNTKVLVLSIKVSEKKYRSIEQYLKTMERTKAEYKYNMLGLMLAGFKIHFVRKKHYYCSEFIRHVLELHHIKGAKQLNPIAHPMHFTELPDVQVVYCGRLQEFGKDVTQTV